MKNIKFLVIPALFATLASCVNGDDYGTPDLSNECVTIPKNKEVNSITSVATSTATQYTTGENVDYIEAYVTSSDEGGNFYKSISMVSTDGEHGFSMPVNSYNLYTKYEPGRKVTIKLDKNRYYNRQHEGTVIGSSFENTVGRISSVEYQDVILRSCDKVDEEVLVNNLTIAQAMNNANLNKLIEFDNVQFTDGSVGGKYYDKTYPAFVFANPTYPSNNSSATNHQITDADGNKIVVRVSEYASFAGNLVSTGNGKIRGVLTKFGSTFQFMVRTIHDVKLDNPRVDYSFLNSVNENFSSYANNNSSFPLYYNLSTAGTYLWQVKEFSSNKYIQMSSFGSGGSNRALFVIPVNFDSANNLSFKTKDGFNNGNALKVYYSLNFNPSNPAGGTLVDITSNFAIATGTASGYAVNFTNSGTYNLGLSGNGYIIFEYVGNSPTGVTTTMQIDDIVIN